MLEWHQSEYQRGVSAWNFDVEDLKFQASLLQEEEDEIQEIKEEEDSVKYHTNHKVVSSSVVKQEATGDNSSRGKLVVNDVLVVESQTKNGKVSDSDLFQTDNQVNTGVKGGSRADLAPPVVEKDVAQAKTRTQTGRARQTQSGPLIPGAVLSHSQSERVRNLESAQMQISSVENCTLHWHLALVLFGIRNKTLVFTLPDLMPLYCLLQIIVVVVKLIVCDSGKLFAFFSVSLGLPCDVLFEVYNYLFDLDLGIAAFMWYFMISVSVADLYLYARIFLCVQLLDVIPRSPLRKSASVGSWIFDSKQMPNSQPAKEIGNSNVPASVLMPQLQNLFQQTSIQQDLIMNLLSSLQLVDIENAPQNGKLPPLPRSENNGSAELVVSERERMLLTKISELQARMISLTDELTAEKVKYTQGEKSRKNGTILFVFLE
ncbi:UNVERIFIED_CONTAM: hypothetical protein Scaly_2436400 [Sesamum calycinum]|uniref:Uncharacterized protein n=1 Tax=Sesamum calycinum TaxID=2727403 RepID=A0AAW2M0U5_9LAMI